jgi:hypothetical protein
MKTQASKPVRCAIYTRVSTDHGLEQDFSSLDAQHDAAQAYIRSQAHAGWTLIRSRYAPTRPGPNCSVNGPNRQLIRLFRHVA